MGIDQSAAPRSSRRVPSGRVRCSPAPSSTQRVPTNVVETKIAAQVSSKSAWAVTNEFDKQPSPRPTTSSAFAELASGQVQYVAADAIIRTYAAHSAGDDVHIVALMRQAGGYGGRVGCDTISTGVRPRHADRQRHHLASSRQVAGYRARLKSRRCAGRHQIHGRGRDRCFEAEDERRRNAAGTLLLPTKARCQRQR
ncbi:MAG: hypothetical protein ACLSVD_10010 [Eggerthellaceae bacterium]